MPGEVKRWVRVEEEEEGKKAEQEWSMSDIRISDRLRVPSRAVVGYGRVAKARHATSTFDVRLLLFFLLLFLFFSFFFFFPNLRIARCKG